MLIAPASATTLARLAHGLADNMLALTALATTAPVLVAPAMDAQMWAHAATRPTSRRCEAPRRHLRRAGRRTARERPHRRRPPRRDGGAARRAARRRSARRGDLAGRRIVVSAGGTQEPLDPVRYVGNRSSGKMGFAIAEAARDRGAARRRSSAGPVALPTPFGVERIDVRTTAEMAAAIAHATEAATR